MCEGVQSGAKLYLCRVMRFEDCSDVGLHLGATLNPTVNDEHISLRVACAWGPYLIQRAPLTASLGTMCLYREKRLASRNVRHPEHTQNRISPWLHVSQYDPNMASALCPPPPAPALAYQ